MVLVGPLFKVPMSDNQGTLCVRSAGTADFHDELIDILIGNFKPCRPRCMGYAHCCVCPTCKERATKPRKAEPQPPQPWDIIEKAA